jgi:effector-binding domain-containing protein
MGEFEIVDVQEQKVASVRRTVPTAELPAFFAEAFEAVAAAVDAGGGAITGPPFGRYRSMPTETVDVEAGFPVEGWDGSSGEVNTGVRPGGRAVVGVHVGPYDTMAETYERLQAWCAEEGVTLATEMWEEYTSPPEGDPSTWRTRIVWNTRS